MFYIRQYRKPFYLNLRTVLKYTLYCRLTVYFIKIVRTIQLDPRKTKKVNINDVRTKDKSSKFKHIQWEAVKQSNQSDREPFSSTQSFAMTSNSNEMIGCCQIQRASCYYVFFRPFHNSISFSLPSSCDYEIGPTLDFLFSKIFWGLFFQSLCWIKFTIFNPLNRYLHLRFLEIIRRDSFALLDVCIK